VFIIRFHVLELADVVVYAFCLVVGGSCAMEYSYRGRVAEGLVAVEIDGTLCSMVSCTYG